MATRDRRDDVFTVPRVLDVTHLTGLRDRTQADYERVFKAFAPTLDNDLRRFTTPVIVHMRDKARDRHGFKFANQMVVVLKMVFAFGVEYGHMDSNPARDVSPVRRPDDLPDANRPWRPAEATAMMKAPIHIAAPIAIAAYLGLRQGDILKLSRGAITERLLTVTTSKTRRSLELPVCDDLCAILARYEAWRREAFEAARKPDMVTTLFVNTRCQPWTTDGFRTSFGKWRDQQLKAGKIEAGITFHGARHTVATILAEAGYEQEKVKHLLGHGSETITEHYSRRAKRRSMLKEMADTVQMAYRLEGKNVVSMGRIENGSV